MAVIDLAALIIFAVVLLSTLIIAWGARQLVDLAQTAPAAGKTGPLVSIIVPACNEEQTIAAALQTLVAQEYEQLEIIVVNDRSTDGTATVLAALQQRYPQLMVLTVNELPPGWLGKNHALQLAAGQARGDILLFTDADIHMAPSTVGRAVARLEAKGLDHLSLIFKNKARGWLLNGLILDAGGGLFMLFQPWRVASSPRHFMGVGAFNMVRRAMYEEVGGHGPLALHPIDDIMLGKVINEAGGRQECLSAYDYVTVHWYPSVAGMVDGLMKNVFALCDFKPLLALAAALAVALLTMVPPWGVLLTDGLARLFFLLTVLLRLLQFYGGCRHSGLSGWVIFSSFLTPYLTCYIILRSCLVTLVQGGIRWRGTLYSLEELRTNRSLL